jgi:hypothetical protein
VISTEYTGRERVEGILRRALDTLGQVRFTDELHSADLSTHALVFDATVTGQAVQGIFYLGIANGRIGSLTLMMRPARGQQAFVDAMLTRGAEPALDFASGTQ